MSEEERKQRMSYRKKRKSIMTMQSIIIIVLAIVTVFTAVLGVALNKTYYVSYSEKNELDWGVHLRENDFYEDTYLGKDYAYVSSLIDKIQAEFTYVMQMHSKNPVDFQYSYRVDAILQVKDKTSGKVLFSSVHNEIPERKVTSVDKNIEIRQMLVVDYDKYNDIASRFIDTYDLNGAQANLLLNMQVDVTGKSEEFDGQKNSNSCVSTINIPLTTKTVEVKITSSVPKEEQKVLSYTTENVAKVFKTVSTIFAVFTALGVIALFAYAYMSRNIDITYDIKVARLVRNYKSFIQKIRNSFDFSKYQVLIMDDFDAMLEIRDTIESPILFEENVDKTSSKFFIPTSNGLVYLYEIRVDDYDEIYSNEEDITDIARETVPTDAKVEAPVKNEVEAELTDTKEVYTETDKGDIKQVSEWVGEPYLYISDGKLDKKKKKMRVRITLNK